MKHKSVIPIVVLVVFQLCHSSWALPTTAQQAKMVVTGWLQADSQPLGADLGRQVTAVETYTDDHGEPLYYIVYLQPSGFVIVAGDDRVEPIIGFVNGTTYDPSPENPLGALITNDLHGRSVSIRNTVGPLATAANATATETQKKWNYFLDLAEASNDGIRLMGLPSISDVRVAPLVETKWNQEICCRNPNVACYNYYTPQWIWDNIDEEVGHIAWIEGDSNNYPSGCVATAMAQLIRYHKYPEEGIGMNAYDIRVGYSDNDQVQGTQSTTAYTRGGDGAGGPYQWHLMVAEPGCGTNVDECRAIGALCYDAGISVNMKYAENSSSSNTLQIADALKNTFYYGNAIKGENGGTNMDVWLIGIINSNLDAQKPVILRIARPEAGHAVICDGYGYNSSTPYHHLNMGWGGSKDAWYNLPDMATSESRQYDTIRGCVYNIYKSGGGEIISGRVMDENGMLAENAAVYRLPSDSEDPCAVYTNSQGIYFFDKLDSNTTYTLWASVEGYEFPDREVTTGTSQDGSPISGNQWGIDFPWSTPPARLYVDCNVIGGDNDGSDWNHALTNLQDAIEVAVNSRGEVREIWVAEGTYKPDKGTGLRSLSFELVNDVGLYGGFAGGETERSQRNPEINPTILSGDIKGDDGENFLNNDENSFHIVNGGGTNGTAILDGFTITGGNASGSGRTYGYGAGMFISKGSPTVKNCKFINNNASGNGGGIYNYLHSSPILTNCTFNSNSAYSNGGGIYNYSYSSPILTNCTFSGNSAWSGGGMYNYRNSNPTLTNCLLNGNSARSGGGMYNYNTSPILTNCTFSDNSASLNGGGIYNDGNYYLSLTNCILWYNLPDQITSLSGSIITYSNIQGGFPGEGNIDMDPMFADPNNEDCHLKSQAGRLDSNSQSWVIDDLTSPCIDAGDPNSPVGDEPEPHGGRLNMGAYGGTAQASKSTAN